MLDSRLAKSFERIELCEDRGLFSSGGLTLGTTQVNGVLAGGAGAAKRLGVAERKVPLRVGDTEAESSQSVVDAFWRLKPSFPASTTKLFIPSPDALLMPADRHSVRPQFNTRFRECEVGMALVRLSTLSDLAHPVIRPLATTNSV